MCLISATPWGRSPEAGGRWRGKEIFPWRMRQDREAGGRRDGGRKEREDEEEGGGENRGEEGDPSGQPSSSALLFGILSEQLPPA